MGLWRRYLAWRQRHVVELELTGSGFAIVGYRGRVDIRWDAVQRINAYKRDLYTVDLLCLAILAGEQVVEVDERMEGFEAFDAAMHDALGITPAWKLDVLFPAFEENTTEIYRRDDGGADWV